MKKKVLYISRSYVNNSPGGVRYLNFIKHLEENYNLTVINLTNSSLLYGNNNIINRIINRIVRKLPLLPDSDVLILKKYKKAIIKSLKQNNFNTVIIGILPYSFLYLAKFIKNINKDINVIVDMSDPISASISFNSLSERKRIFFLNLEKIHLPYVDTLIVLNNEIKQYYEKKYRVNQVIVIEQGIDEAILEQKIKNIKSTRISFIYVGHLYKEGREPYELYKGIKETSYDVKLNVYGNVKKYFYPPKNKRFFCGGRITREKLKKKYAESNVIVFIDNKDTLQVPGKTLEISALNKPVLFIYYNEDSPTLNYVKNHKGIFLTKNNSANIKRTIENIIDNNIFYYNRDLSMYYWDNLLNKLYEVI